jgi:pimeloyl-ACP methyl ester carboxylesterase
VISLAYDDQGVGEPVVFISGRGGAGSGWHLHQVPAFLAAGYRVITFDNRGIGATANDEGFTIHTMVADTAALIESLDIAPARIVAVSMGSFIAQELMLARPELVRAAVLMATRGRLDRAREFFRAADAELYDAGLELPPAYRAKIRLLEGLSGKSLDDDAEIGSWISMFRMFPTKLTPGYRCQLEAGPRSNRVAAYRNVATRALVIGFADDVISPPHLGREVAGALPHGTYLQIPDAGHLGFLEQPEAVNAAALKFFGSSSAT